MNHPKPLPPLEELQEVFELSEDCASGFIWKINPSKQGGKKRVHLQEVCQVKGQNIGKLSTNKNLIPAIGYGGRSLTIV